MIEKSTLEALNYFLDEDIQNCKDAMKEFEGFDNLQAYYNGQIKGLEYAIHLINQQWKSERGMLLNIDFDELMKIAEQNTKRNEDGLTIIEKDDTWRK